MRKLAKIVIAVVLMLASAAGSKQPKQVAQPGPPDLMLEGGRRLTWERSFSSEFEVKPKRGFWTRVVDFIAGEPEFRRLIRPYSVATDSRGRIIVTDPGANGIHVFDFREKKYKFLTRSDQDKDATFAPQCVAVDSSDNIYVTDSEAGKVFVFGANLKYERAIGSLKNGEGYFKRPTGIAVDSAEQRIYVTDTLRDKIFKMDMQGSVLQTIGSKGSGDGEFNYPTELRLEGDNLLVVDAMNFRVQVLDKSGAFRYAVGTLGDTSGTIFRPKGVGLDSEGDLYIVDGFFGIVQVFNRQGDLLYYFGGRGAEGGQFQMPAGLSIDRDDRIYVVDSLNRRVQVYRFYAAGRGVGGSK